MSSQALARKYRPQDFDAVIGQETTVRILKNALAEKRLHHAYLFTGPRGIGKTSLARIFAKALNCQKGDAPQQNPCGECLACKEITEGRSLSVQEIDGASNTSVEDVRDLRERIRYLPPGGRYKIYIIDEVHMLSTAAFNALLKTLEEPPAHALFLFATTDPQKIPATVLSRVLRFDLRPIPKATIVAHLKKIADQEKIQAEEGALFQIARDAEGGLRDALSLMDQIVAFGNGRCSAEAAQEVLGVSTQGFIRRLLKAVLEKNGEEALKAAEDAAQAGLESKKLSLDLLEALRHLLVAQVTRDPQLFDLPQEDIEEFAKLAQAIRPEDLDRIFRMLQKGVGDLLRSSLPRVLLDALVLRLSHWEELRPMDEILASLQGGTVPKPAPQGAVSSYATAPTQPPALSHKAQTPPPAAPPVKGSRSWPEFISFLRGKSPRLSALVEQGTLSSLTDSEVVLQYPPKSMTVELLKEGERESAIKFHLQEFFGKPLIARYEWAGGNSPSGTASAPSGTGKSIVDDAISIFGPKNVINPAAK